MEHVANRSRATRTTSGRQPIEAPRATSRRAMLIVAMLWVLIFVLIPTFSSSDIRLDTIDGRVLYVEKRWWGWHTEEREIRWMKVPGYGSHAWAARNNSGEWNPLLTGDAELVADESP